MKKAYLVLIIFCGYLIISCNKVEVSEEVPKCIIKIINRDKDYHCLQEVYTYDYNGEIFYGLSYPCPEGCFILLDSDCNTLTDSKNSPLCYCDWGGTHCNFKDDFFIKRVNERFIWQKKL